MNDEHLLLVVQPCLRRRQMTSICCSLFIHFCSSTLPSTTMNDEHLLLVVRSFLFLNPAFNNDERQAFVARRSFIFGELKCKHEKVQCQVAYCSPSPAHSL